MTRITKKGLADRRFKNFEVKEFNFWQKYGSLICAGILGLLAGIVLGQSLWNATHPKMVSPKGRKPTVEIKVEKVQAASRPWCYDAIGCIRDVGEELGIDNKNILTAIRIARCESNFRTDALNKNKNGTFDMGVFQINDVHGKRISRADRMDMEKNIRFAYRLFKEQHGFQAWSCYKKVK